MHNAPVIIPLSEELQVQVLLVKHIKWCTYTYTLTPYTYTYTTLDAPPLSAKFSDGGAKYQIIHLQFLLCRVDAQVSQEVPELLGGHKPGLCLVKLPERLDKL